MAVDLSPIDADLLKTLTNVHGIPEGAYNIRKDGELLTRHNSANIEIATKTDNPGIDIYIKDGTKGERVYIPVIVSKAGLKDVVYNTFHIGENCDVVIIAGCGIHNDSHKASEHDGIHTFHIGKNSRVKYVENHYGEGSGDGARILNPVTKVYQDENSFCEMEMVQIRGVTSTVRDTDAELGAGAKLILTEKLLTDGDQKATSNMNIRLVGDNSNVQVISRVLHRIIRYKFLILWYRAKLLAMVTYSVTLLSWVMQLLKQFQVLRRLTRMRSLFMKLLSGKLQGIKLLSL